MKSSLCFTQSNHQPTIPNEVATDSSPSPEHWSRTSISSLASFSVYSPLSGQPSPYEAVRSTFKTRWQLRSSVESTMYIFCRAYKRFPKDGSRHNAPDVSLTINSLTVVARYTAILCSAAVMGGKVPRLYSSTIF